MNLIKEIIVLGMFVTLSAIAGCVRTHVENDKAVQFGAEAIQEQSAVCSQVNDENCD